MTLTEKLYALRRSPVFQGVDENELLLLAEAAQLRSYAPGAVICRAGECPPRLFVPIVGTAQFASGAKTAAVFDLSALLYDQPLAEDIVASATDSVHCLAITKGHFFTLVNECPMVLLNVLRDAVPVNAGESEERPG